MNWFFPAIGALILWGSGQVFIKKGLTSISPFVSNLIAVFFILLIEIPFALLGKVNWSYFPAIFLIGFFAQIPNFIYPYVINKANVSLAGTVLAAYPFITVILSLLFLNESLSLLQVIGIAGIMIGMFLVAKPENEKFEVSQWLIWALFGALIVGTGDFIGKVGITKYDLNSFIFAFALSAVPGLLIIRLFDKSPLTIKGSKKDILFSAIGNLIMPLGLLFLYIAFNSGPASLISPIASSYPALTAVLAYIFLKEKINKTNSFGIVLATLGIVLTGI